METTITFVRDDKSEIILSVRQSAQPLYVLGGVQRPDPKWQFIDSLGHIHQWGDIHKETLPTLSRHEETEYYGCSMSYDEYYCCDGWEETVISYTCTECGEAVVPGYRADMSPLYQYGRAEFYINDVPVTEEVYKAKKAELLTEYKKIQEEKGKVMCG